MPADYELAKSRFDGRGAAAHYNGRLTGSARDRREKDCVAKALADLADGSLVLDLPCGTGRISCFLHGLGFRVVAADSSAEMIRLARQNLEQSMVEGQDLLAQGVRCEQQDILEIQHADDTFDAAVCNRLFHHYCQAATRRRALAELRRVTRGPIVVSFFSSFAVSALLFRCRHFLRGTTPNDRIPISPAVFRQDIQASGLRTDATYSVRYGISPQTYVKLSRA